MMAEQSTSYNADGAADGGGGRSITQPFSPGDTGGKVGKGGSRNSLARFLSKQGVGREVAQRVGDLSVSLFANLDLEGLHHFAGDDPTDRAIMRAAQASLKGELASEEAEAGLKRNRNIFDIYEEEREEEEESAGQDTSAAASSQRQVEELRLRALHSRKQPRSAAVIVYEDPYMMGASEEGKLYILSVYGDHSSDGTKYARRMASMRYNDAAPKGSTILKIPQLNVALVSGNKADAVRRSEAICTILMIVDPSRWAALYQNDWDINMHQFMKKSFEHWALIAEERTIAGWTGIDKLKMVAGTAPIKTVETISSLLEFKWTVTGGLSISMFENFKGESRSSNPSVCTKDNEGLASVIRRLSNIMVALMSSSYLDVFAHFIRFVTEGDEVASMRSDQVAYNFNYAMMKVGNAVSSVTSMRLGDGTEFSTRGPFEVATAIVAAMGYQVSLMRSKPGMREQRDDFEGIMARQANRAQGGSGSKPTSRDVTSRDVAHGALDESDNIIRQSKRQEDKKPGKGSKGDKKEGGEKSHGKSNFLCVGYLGESLGARAGGIQSKCVKGQEKCYFVHRRAGSITRIEAEEAMMKPADSDMNRAIRKKVAEFKEFMK
jgi:hypothetical protein